MAPPIEATDGHLYGTTFGDPAVSGLGLSPGGVYEGGAEGARAPGAGGSCHGQPMGRTRPAFATASRKPRSAGLEGQFYVISPQLGDAVGGMDISDDVKAHIRGLRTPRSP